VLCSNPTVEAPRVFEPSVQNDIPNSPWKIDYNQTSIDGDGWTYAFDFATLNKTGAGENAAKWNTYVRRRKWKYTESSSGSSAKVAEIAARHATRVGGQKGGANSPVGGGSTQGEKIGYASRVQVSTMKASGLTSAGMMGGKKNQQDQELDAESAAGLKQIQDDDADIDNDINDVSNAIDRLGNLASNMKEEALSHNKKLDRLDTAMQTAGEKQAVVNNRLARQIKKN